MYKYTKLLLQPYRTVSKRLSSLFGPRHACIHRVAYGDLLPLSDGGFTIDSCTQVTRTSGLYQSLGVSYTLPTGCAQKSDHQMRSLTKLRRMAVEDCT